MLERYSLPEMAAVWSEERKLELWQEIEALVAEAWSEKGLGPTGAAEAIRAAQSVTPAELAELEEVTGHDVAAFVDLLSERSGAAASLVHYGLTSSDVVDTANGVRMRDSAELLLARLADLFDIVKRRALEHRHSQMVGRTHGMWAEPTSFGLKLATWGLELARGHRRLAQAQETVAVGKISGAVGTYAHVPPEIEAYVCERLEIEPEPASTQITQRDRYAEFLQTLALTGTSIERFSTEIRHLSRSEIAEVSEPFGERQKGSSAMPHKRNPIMSERMTGLARLLRGYSLTALENVALWHERDISHSSAERVIVPDACLILHYMLVKFTELVENLVVDTGRMRENLEATRGLVFSQAVLLALITKGLARDDAYRIVQRNATEAQDAGMEFRDVLTKDPDVKLSEAELNECFSTARSLANSAVVFERLEEVKLTTDR